MLCNDINDNNIVAVIQLGNPIANSDRCNVIEPMLAEIILTLQDITTVLWKLNVET